MIGEFIYFALELSIASLDLKVFRDCCQTNKNQIELCSISRQIFYINSIKIDGQCVA